ncbi:MAG: YdcF family protein [Actinobacteria bacterium]|nr:MAG: YdcF family protein [Actinomycetota bacterium]
MRLVRRHPILALLALGLALALVAIGASGVVVWRAAHHDDASDVERADAIVVLGAAQYNGTPSPVFRGRLEHAVVLWQQDRSDLVITVGSNQPGDHTTEAQAGRDYLVSRGIPASAILALPVGHATFDSLEAAAAALHGRGLTSAFLVSDPWHNARIKAMASDLGLTGYASATWTSGDTSEETRGRGYVRDTFAYLYLRLFGP